jgi:glycosyltransferase involved in cell wall biosynthesis
MIDYTIIIPHYNIPRLLRRLLRTIPQREDLQVIVVDDCSPKEALDEMAVLQTEFQNVEWYSTGTNGGGGKARNIGLQHAKGKYLIFADADDFFNLCFEETLDAYKDTSYDEVLFVTNSVDTETYQPSDRGSHLIDVVKRYEKTHDVADLKYKHTAPWAKFVRREIVERNNITFQESPVYNDMRFNQQVDYYSKNFCTDERAIYCVTFRYGSVSCVDNVGKELSKVRVMNDYYNFFRQHSIPYDCMGLIAPTYFGLKKLGHKNEARLTLQMWQEECGLSKQQIVGCLVKYQVISKLLPKLNAFKKIFC